MCPSHTALFHNHSQLAFTYNEKNRSPKTVSCGTPLPASLMQNLKLFFKSEQKHLQSLLDAREKFVCYQNLHDSIDEICNLHDSLIKSLFVIDDSTEKSKQWTLIIDSFRKFFCYHKFSASVLKFLSSNPFKCDTPNAEKFSKNQRQLLANLTIGITTMEISRWEAYPIELDQIFLSASNDTGIMKNYTHLKHDVFRKLFFASAVRNSHLLLSRNCDNIKSVLHRLEESTIKEKIHNFFFKAFSKKTHTDWNHLKQKEILLGLIKSEKLVHCGPVIVKQNREPFTMFGFAFTEGIAFYKLKMKQSNSSKEMRVRKLSVCSFPLKFGTEITPAFFGCDIESVCRESEFVITILITIQSQQCQLTLESMQQTDKLADTDKWFTYVAGIRALNRSSLTKASAYRESLPKNQSTPFMSKKSIGNGDSSPHQTPVFRLNESFDSSRVRTKTTIASLIDGIESNAYQSIATDAICSGCKNGACFSNFLVNNHNEANCRSCAKNTCGVSNFNLLHTFESCNLCNLVQRDCMKVQLNYPHATENCNKCDMNTCLTRVLKRLPMDNSSINSDPLRKILVGSHDSSNCCACKESFCFLKLLENITSKRNKSCEGCNNNSCLLSNLQKSLPKDICVPQCNKFNCINCLSKISHSSSKCDACREGCCFQKLFSKNLDHRNESCEACSLGICIYQIIESMHDPFSCKLCADDACLYTNLWQNSSKEENCKNSYKLDLLNSFHDSKKCKTCNDGVFSCLQKYLFEEHFRESCTGCQSKKCRHALCNWQKLLYSLKLPHNGSQCYICKYDGKCVRRAFSNHIKKGDTCEACQSENNVLAPFTLREIVNLHKFSECSICMNQDLCLLDLLNSHLKTPCELCSKGNCIYMQTISHDIITCELCQMGKCVLLITSNHNENCVYCVEQTCLMTTFRNRAVCGGCKNKHCLLNNLLSHGQKCFSCQSGTCVASLAFGKHLKSHCLSCNTLKSGCITLRFINASIKRNDNKNSDESLILLNRLYEEHLPANEDRIETEQTQPFVIETEVCSKGEISARQRASSDPAPVPYWGTSMSEALESINQVWLNHNKKRSASITTSCSERCRLLHSRPGYVCQNSIRNLKMTRRMDIKTLRTMQKEHKHIIPQSINPGKNFKVFNPRFESDNQILKMFTSDVDIPSQI